MTNNDMPPTGPNGNQAFDVAAIRPIPYQGHTVITTDLLARAYGADANNIQMNFSRNEGRFIEGIHFFKLTGDALREFKNSPTGSGSVDKRAPALMLWTARGAARHAKILDTDEAWAMFEKLEDAYFNPPRATAPQIDVRDPSQLTKIAIQLIEVNRELETRAVIAERAVEAAKPKTEFYDKFANADGLYGLQNAGRVLGQRPNKFIGWLKQGYLFYQGHALIPKVQYREMGIFEVIVSEKDGKSYPQTYVTPRGIIYFAKKLGVDQLPLDIAA